MAEEDGVRHRVFAVLIGVQNYQNADLYRELLYARQDVDSMRQELARWDEPSEDEDGAPHGHPWTEVRVLASPPLREDAPPATRKEIEYALKMVASEAGPDDVLLLWFSGHGVIHEDKDGVPRLYLQPADADEKSDSWIGMDEVNAWVSDSRTRRRFAFIDACQSPSAASPPPGEQRAVMARAPLLSPRGGEVLISPTDQARAEAEIQKTLLQGDWTAILASRPFQPSYEVRPGDQQRHGILTYVLLEAMGQDLLADDNGDGIVSFADVGAYASRQVPQYAWDLLRVRQHPLVIYGRSSDEALIRGGVAEPERRWPTRGFARLWLARILGPWPYRRMAVQQVFRFGVGVLYGIAWACEVGWFLAQAGKPWITPASLVALGTVALWLVMAGLSVAAEEERWRTGGYAAGMAVLLWNVAVAVVVGRLAPVVAGRAGLELGVYVAALSFVVVAFGTNILHMVITLARLHEKRPAVLYEIIRDRRGISLAEQANGRRGGPANWFMANVRAFTPAVQVYPEAYGWGVVAGVALAAADSLAVWIARPVVSLAGAGLELVRDAVLATLMLMEASAYGAVFEQLKIDLVPRR